MSTTTERRNLPAGPVLFAYDGSELAKVTIDESGRQLGSGREALVLTIWHPFDVGFVPAGGVRFNPAQISDVKEAAERTAAEGAALAQAAGFSARSAAAEDATSWKGIVDSPTSTMQL